MIYLFQSTYKPFVIPCYNIIQCIVFNFVVIIAVFTFISKYLYHSFETLNWISFTNSRFLFTLWKFPNPPLPAPSNPLTYLILSNVPTPLFIRNPSPLPPAYSGPKSRELERITLKGNSPA